MLAQTSTLDSLPNEIILKVIRYLSSTDILVINVVNKRLNSVTNDNSIWKKHCKDNGIFLKELIRKELYKDTVVLSDRFSSIRSLFVDIGLPREQFHALILHLSTNSSTIVNDGLLEKLVRSILWKKVYVLYHKQRIEILKNTPCIFTEYMKLDSSLNMKACAFCSRVNHAYGLEMNNTIEAGPASINLAIQQQLSSNNQEYAGILRIPNSNIMKPRGVPEWLNVWKPQHHSLSTESSPLVPKIALLEANKVSFPDDVCLHCKTTAMIDSLKLR
jgi:hypothetical protein